MRRNETILVYGVTGLLFVILFVAVVFGNEGQAAPLQREEGIPTAQATPKEEDKAQRLEDLLNLDPVGDLEEDPVPTEPEADLGAVSEGEEGSAAEESEQDEPAPAPETETLPSSEPDPMVADASGRIGNGMFREVTVEKGQSFSLLVLHHTGSLDNMDTVRALNEDLDPERLEPGRKILLPFVEEEKLAELRKERLAEAAIEKPATGDQLYEVRDGDSLWKIAVQATGDRRQAPNFINEVMRLNPDLVPEKLRVGQKIVLP